MIARYPRSPAGRGLPPAVRIPGACLPRRGLASLRCSVVAGTMTAMRDTSSGFRFLPVDRVVSGRGAVRTLPVELDRAGRQRALVITGESIATSTDLLWYAEQLLGPRHAASYTGAR